MKKKRRKQEGLLCERIHSREYIYIGKPFWAIFARTIASSCGGANASAMSYPNDRSCLVYIYIYIYTSFTTPSKGCHYKARNQNPKHEHTYGGARHAASKKKNKM